MRVTSHVFHSSAKLPLSPARVFLRERANLFSVPCVSNDAVGHSRRWHLLLMVTPAHGGPCGPAWSSEKEEEVVEEEERRKGGLSDGNVVGCRGFLIMHANSKSHTELKPSSSPTKPYISLFFPYSYSLSNVFPR